MSIGGCHMIIAGENLSVSMTQDDEPAATTTSPSVAGLVPKNSDVASPGPDRIRELRLKLQMRQHQFADLMNVQQCTVSRWEAGEAEPSGPACILLNLMISQHCVDQN